MTAFYSSTQRKLAIVLPYYDQPKMLALQYATLARLPAKFKEHMRVVIVDDGSPEHPAADVPRPAWLPDLRMYRIDKDVPWGWHAARNIGAFEAESTWLLMTDLDHLVTDDMLAFTLDLRNEKRVYNFLRVDAPDMNPTLGRQGEHKAHPNTYLMSHALYWRIGGFDERFCGWYGADSYYKARLAPYGKVEIRDELLIRVPREYVSDAGVSLPRKEGREKGYHGKLKAMVTRTGGLDAVKVLKTPYRRTL